jgi:hypothetical protein
MARRFSLLRPLGIFFATWTLGHAQSVPTAEPASPLSLATLAAALPAWGGAASVETGFGYKDNLLLSHTGEEGSAFIRSGVDASAIHLRLGDRTDYSFGFAAGGTHYFSGGSVDHDAHASALARWRWHEGEVFKFTFDLQGYYQDQVFDVSDTELQRVVAQLKVAGAIAGPTVRWRFLPWLWLEGRAVGNRRSYQETEFNHTMDAGTVRLGWRPGSRFELSLAGTARTRHYDSHPQYSVSGRPLTGTLLKIFEREAELLAEVTWDRAEHWKTKTFVGRCDFRDNGSGYSNYREGRLEQDLDWAAGNWLVHAEGEAKHQLYAVQTVGVGFSPTPRVKDIFSAQLRVERKLTERWALFGEFNWDRNRCNDPIASYNMNEGLLGVRWNWEK